MSVKRRYPNTPPSRVLIGKRFLDNWYTCPIYPDNSEWVVAHYVGGEEFEVVDDYFFSEEEAKARVAELNERKDVYEYFRDWEGDPDYEY